MIQGRLTKAIPHPLFYFGSWAMWDEHEHLSLGSGGRQRRVPRRTWSLWEDPRGPGRQDCMPQSSAYVYSTSQGHRDWDNEICLLGGFSFLPQQKIGILTEGSGLISHHPRPSPPTRSAAIRPPGSFRSHLCLGCYPPAPGRQGGGHHVISEPHDLLTDAAHHGAVPVCAPNRPSATPYGLQTFCSLPDTPSGAPEHVRNAFFFFKDSSIYS